MFVCFRWCFNFMFLLLNFFSFTHPLLVIHSFIHSSIYTIHSRINYSLFWDREKQQQEQWARKDQTNNRPTNNHNDDEKIWAERKRESILAWIVIVTWKFQTEKKSIDTNICTGWIHMYPTAISTFSPFENTIHIEWRNWIE